MLQSKAGYIDARPHIRQLEEVLLQRTAGPYIGSQAGITPSLGHVCFAPESRHRMRRSACPLSARSGRGEWRCDREIQTQPSSPKLGITSDNSVTAMRRKR